MWKRFTNYISKSISFQHITYSPDTQDIDAIFGDGRIQSKYKESLYFLRALGIIKDSVSTIDFYLYRIKNAAGETEKVEVSPIIDLLYKPNPHQTKNEFWSLLVSYYRIHGEFFVRKIRNGTKVAALVIINPSQVTVEISDTGNVTYSIYGGDGKTITIPSEDMIHAKDPDPSNHLRGASPLGPLYARIVAEINTVDYQGSLFGRNGTPDIVVNVKGADASALAKLKASYLNAINGKNERNRAAFFNSEETTVTPLNSAGSTLDFKTSKDTIRDDVFMALGVPKSLATTDDVNRANAEAGIQQLMQFTIAPMFERFLEALNERMVAVDFGEDLYIDTNQLVTEDRQKLIEEAKAGVDKWLTVNEVRERFGYEPLDGNDELDKRSGYSSQYSFNDHTVENSLKVISRRNTLRLRFIAQRAVKSAAYRKLLADPVFKVKFSDAVEGVRARGERIIKRDARQYFKELLQRIEEKAKNADSVMTASDLFDTAKEKEEITRFVLPLYQAISVSAGNTSLSPIKMVSEKGSRFVMNSVLFRQLEERAKLFSDSVSSTAYDVITTIVAEKLNEGVPAIVAALREKFEESTKASAERIARTESGYMTSLGSQMAYDQSEVVSGKQWLTTGDDRVREEHAAVDGEIVAKYETFSNGEMFPADKSINCRCTAAPVVDFNKL